MPRRSVRRAAAGLAILAGVLAAGAPARAQESFLLPLDPAEPLALGTPWDGDERRPIAERDACMTGSGAERHEGGPATWTVVVLSRAGGRLLVGVHAARTIASEGLADATIPDAARRLAGRDRDEFHALCGDGFVSARALGGQYVGEIELGPSEAKLASARLRTGVWTEPGPFEAAVAPLLAASGAQARELPAGRRADAVRRTPAELIERAVAFPATVTVENAAPFLASVRSYPEWAFAGTVVQIDPTLGWGDAARAVFLHDTGAFGGTTAASRAAEMRKALVKRRPGGPQQRAYDPAEAAQPALAAAEPAPPAIAVAEASTDRAAPVSEPEPASPAAELPAAVAAPSAPPAPSQRRRIPALVYETPGSPPVYATTQAPPGVFGEQVKQRVYWVPGVAAPTDEVREALARAAAGQPTRGTTIVVADVEGTAVVLTDLAPVAGVHAEPAGALQAWIPGVVDPSPAQRGALAAAARAGD